MTTRSVAAITWAATAAVSVNLFIPMRWWHPLCRPNAEGAGPFGYAIGTPLTYAQPTGITSLAYFFMPRVYALDLLLITAIVSLTILPRGPLTRALGGGLGRAVAISGAIALSLAVAAQAIVFSLDWYPVLSIATRPETLLDYRPAVLVDSAKVRGCSY